MQISYHGRTQQADQPYRYYSALVAMARDVDWLVVIAPGSAETQGLVSREVLEALGPKGCLVNVARGSLVDETALVALLTSGKLGGAALEKIRKRHLDAPVSGGEKGAIEATLAIMAGGGKDDLADAETLLKSMGNVTHVGDHGAGQVAKLANQAIVAVTIGAVAEALLLAQEGGCDPVAVRSAIMGGFATSRILDLHGQRMLERNWIPGGPIRMQLKDLNNVIEVAREAGLTLPLTEKAQRAYSDLNDAMSAGNQDHSAYLLWLEALNGGKRLGQGADRLVG